MTRQDRQLRNVLIGIGCFSVLMFGTLAAVFVPAILRKAPPAALQSQPASTPDMTMTAQEMIDRTAGNPTAMAPHNGKVVRLTGTIRRISAIGPTTTVQFWNHGEKGDSPYCFLKNAADLATFKIGDQITIQGVMNADGAGVNIESCDIIR